jgi:hypothetical protein
MMIMRTTPGIIKATEKYIASLGRKREELTEEQWDFMVNCIKTRRIVIPLFIIMALLCIITIFRAWYLGHECFAKAIPHNTIMISFEDKSEPISLSPKEIRDYFSYTINRYMGAFGGFLLFINVLTYLMIIIGIKKTHRILLSRPATTESAV